MAVGVIDLKEALAPAMEPLLEGDDHSVEIGDGRRSVFRNLAEPGIRAGWNWRAAAQLRRKRPKTKGIGRGVLDQFVNPMISGIADTQGSVGTKGLLQLEAPLLILRRVGLIVRDADARRNEERICFLDCARVCPAA